MLSISLCGRLSALSVGREWAAKPQLILYRDNASASAMELASIAEPQLILYKDNASASAMELASIAEPQLILYKVTDKSLYGNCRWLNLPTNCYHAGRHVM